jgi:hypothetical protein
MAQWKGISNVASLIIIYLNNEIHSSFNVSNVKKAFLLYEFISL